MAVSASARHSQATPSSHDRTHGLICGGLGAGIPGEAELSIWPNPTLPLSRRILRALLERLFIGCGLAAITIRARPEDDVLQWSLTRMGFAASGRDDRPGQAGRLVFTLSAELGLRRAFPRGLSSLGKVS